MNILGGSFQINYGLNNYRLWAGGNDYPDGPLIQSFTCPARSHSPPLDAAAELKVFKAYSREILKYILKVQEAFRALKIYEWLKVEGMSDVTVKYQDS